MTEHPGPLHSTPETAQRIWLAPEIEEPQFLVWTGEALYWIAECPKTTANDLRLRLEAGEKPADVLPPETVVLPLH